MAIVAQYRKQFYDSRHVCWAYRLGGDGSEFRANDDGEPSSTAGKPILGQLLSNELTNVIIIVVRYFGGILLGTGGLIVAYKGAAAEAIAESTIIEKTIEDCFIIQFDYLQMNEVMKVVKDITPKIMTQEFDLVCRMKVSIRMNTSERLRSSLIKIEGVRLLEP